MQDLTKLTIEELKKELDSINDEISNRRKTCTHDRIVYQLGANTGNYSPTDDCYWVTINCMDCGNTSTHYDDTEEYKMKDVGKILKATKEEYAVLKKFNKEK